MPAALVVLFVLWVLVPAVVAGMIMNGKGRGAGLGVLLGLFLGWIGVVVALFLADRRDPAAV